MTDVWCFTCGHELRRVLLSDRWEHEDTDDNNGCPCVIDGMACEP